MKHTLTKDLGNVRLEDVAVPLLPLHSIVIPALCMGRIVHGLVMVTDWDNEDEPSWVCLISEPNTLTTHGLWIESGPVYDGEIITTVFNLTNVEKRIRKTDVVSRLVRIPGAMWKAL